MIDVVDFSKWNTYDGNAEGSGRSEKEWLILIDYSCLFNKHYTMSIRNKSKA